MFPMIFAKNIEIGYAHTSFRWENNAKRNAGVTVVVINLRAERPGQKYIYTDGLQIEAQNINGYLADAPSVFIYRRSRALTAQLPRMVLGSMPKDGGHLILDATERDRALAEDMAADRYLKRYVGSAEFISDIPRYCVWVTDQEVADAQQIPPIARRLSAVAAWRRDRDEAGVKEFATYPNRFKQDAYKPTESIVVPRVSSERRDYVPIGYLADRAVISDAANAIYDAEPWLFSLLTSRMHTAWLRAVGGRMKTDYRYGAYIVYNNFPVPLLSDAIDQHPRVLLKGDLAARSPEDRERVTRALLTRLGSDEPVLERGAAVALEYSGVEDDLRPLVAVGQPHWRHREAVTLIAAAGYRGLDRELLDIVQQAPGRTGYDDEVALAVYAAHALSPSSTGRSPTTCGRWPPTPPSRHRHGRPSSPASSRRTSLQVMLRR